MRVLVAGRRGMLAQELVPCLRSVGLEAVSRGQPELDICQTASIRQTFEEMEPDVLINAAAYSAVDKAESEPDIAFATNRDGASRLAEVCHEVRIPLIHLSTDYVFDGATTRPYKENDLAFPLGIYGKSKWEGEEAVRSYHQKHLIVRTAWLYSRHGSNFVRTMLRLAGERSELPVVNDQYGCPTWAKDLASVLVVICQRLMKDQDNFLWGTYHFCGSGETTWYSFAQAILEEAKPYQELVVGKVVPIPTRAYLTPAQRPMYSVLDCSKIQSAFGITPPAWRRSLHNCIQELYTCPPLNHAMS